ncbi:MAG: hypothetical protein AVDCRST_MAG51-2090, partial [uncultured Ramlibacter sp.]
CPTCCTTRSGSPLRWQASPWRAPSSPGGCACARCGARKPRRRWTRWPAIPSGWLRSGAPPISRATGRRRARHWSSWGRCSRRPFPNSRGRWRSCSRCTRACSTSSGSSNCCGCAIRRAGSNRTTTTGSSPCGASTGWPCTDWRTGCGRWRANCWWMPNPSRSSRP